MALNERDVVVDVTIREHGNADKTAASLDRVDKSADRAGKSMRGMASDAKLLDAEIKKTTARIEELERTMVRTGDRSMQRGIASERRWLASLRRVPGVDFGRKSASEGLNQVIMQLPRQLSGGGILAGLTGVAAAGPLLGGATAGLASGALGTAGLAAGILSAAKDPQVKSAASAFGDSIAEEFFRGGDAFVSPIVESLNILDTAFKDMKVPEALAKLAPTMTTIAEGFAGFGREIMPGLNTAFDRMGPFAETAAEGIAEMGSALGTFMDDVTSSPGAIQGLEAAFMILNATIVATGKTIEYLSDAFAGTLMLVDTPFFRSIPLLGDMIFDLTHSQEVLNDEQKRTKYGIREIGEAAEQTTEEVNKLRDAMMDMIKGNLDASASADRLAEDVFKLRESVMEFGTSLDTTTEQGLANRDMLRGLVEDAMQTRDANIKAGMSVEEANQKYRDQITDLQLLAIKLGFAKDKVAELIGIYKLLPPRITTEIVTQFMQEGKPAGEHSGIRWSETRTVSSSGGFQERAAGGPVMAGVPYTINELGRETVTFPANGMVHPANLSPAGGTVNHVIDLRLNGRTLRQIQIDDAIERGVPQSTVAVAFP